MKFVAGITLIGFSIAGTALAAGQFDDHVANTSIVSPAQMYQTEQGKTDFQAGVINFEGKNKPDGADEVTSKSDATRIIAAGVYNIEGIRAGLTVDRLGSENEDDKSAFTSTDVKFRGAYPVSSFVPAISLNYGMEEYKPEEGDTLSNTHWTVETAVAYVEGPVEAGVSYVSPNNTRPTAEEVADDKLLGVQEAAEVRLHGRYALDSGWAFGGIITNYNYAALNTEDAETDKDGQDITGLVNWNSNGLRVEGALGVSTAHYKEKATMSTSNIGTTNLGSSVDYAVTPAATVGGQLLYFAGSDSGDGIKVSTTATSFALRGNMKF
jgi:hypothetical protein